MKNTSRKTKISVLTAVSALALSGVAFGSSALASDTVTPTPTVATPTISPISGGDTLDSELNAEIDAQGILGGSESTDAILNNQAGDLNGTVEVQENDGEVDAINTDNQQEQASFEEDINAAVQSGDINDAAELSAAAAIVSSVTVPAATAMASDDAEAHAIMTGAPQK